MDSKHNFLAAALIVGFLVSSLLLPEPSDAQDYGKTLEDATKATPRATGPKTTSIPMAPKALPTSTRSVAHLAFHVLELNDDKSLDALNVIKQYFPITAPDAAIFVNELTQDRLNGMIRELVDSKIAHVVSRPQMMTIAEQSAEIEVGQQLEGLPKKDGTVSPPRKVGLQMKCVPHLVSDPSRMQIDIECTVAKADPDRSLVVDGKSYPAINAKQLNTTIAATSGESVVLRGPANNMLIVLTPTWVHPRPQTAVEQVGFHREPVVAKRKWDATIFDEIASVTKAVEATDGTTLLNIAIKDDKLDLQLALDEGMSVSELTESLSELPQVKIDSLNLDRPGKGSIIKIEGRIVTPVRKPNTSAEEMKMLRDDVRSLREDMRQIKELLQSRE